MNKNLNEILDATHIVLEKCYSIAKGKLPDWSNTLQPKYFIAVDENADFIVRETTSRQTSTFYFIDNSEAELLIQTTDTELLLRYLTHNF